MPEMPEPPEVRYLVKSVSKFVKLFTIFDTETETDRRDENNMLVVFSDHQDAIKAVNLLNEENKDGQTD